MWFIPFAPNIPYKRFPVMTVLIIVTNVIVFFMTWNENFPTVMKEYAFVSAHPTLKTMITSQFLHGGYEHIIFNMWFLWIFGSVVEDLIGKIAYVPFYLACGIGACLLHALAAGSGPSAEVPALGASGALFGVMGAYFVIYSKTKIKCLLLFILFPLFTFNVPSLFFLGLKVTVEIVNGLLPVNTGIGHWAHIGGFLFGAGVIQLLISTRAVIVPNLDRVRRGEFATMEAEQRFIGRLDAAYEKKSFKSIPEQYRQLLAIYPTIIFAPEKQLQVGNAVKQAGDMPLAADAYRRVMDCYPGHPSAQRAGIEVAKIANGFFKDKRNAVSYLEWVIGAAGNGPLASEASRLINHIHRG